MKTAVSVFAADRKEVYKLYELVNLGEKTWFVDCPSRIGIYQISDTDVCLIDSGNAPDAGKKVLNICKEKGWEVKYIINTHAHADHTGGNALIQKRTGCRILCAGVDLAMVNHPTLNNSYTFGARPPKELCNKFMLAESSDAEELTADSIPEGLRFESFPGHSFDQSAIICDDGTCFTGDILCGRSTIEKYHIFFLRDIEKYADSARRLADIDAKVFCASHYEPIYDKSEIVSLAELNIKKLGEITDRIKEICRDGKCFDEVLRGVLNAYSLELSFNQYAIAGSTVRSILGSLHDEGVLEAVFEDNFLKWKTV